MLVASATRFAAGLFVAWMDICRWVYDVLALDVTDLVDGITGMVQAHEHMRDIDIERLRNESLLNCYHTSRVFFYHPYR